MTYLYNIIDRRDSTAFSLSDDDDMTLLWSRITNNSHRYLGIIIIVYLINFNKNVMLGLMQDLYL